MVNGVRQATNEYSVEVLRTRSFYRIAWNIHHQWKETGFSDTRLLMAPLISDDFVVVGISKKGGGHKEHIVPRIMICNHCHQLFSQGRTVEEVAAVIGKYLKVVHITEEERYRLDVERGLKTRMPEGWSFENECDPFARLRAAEIEFELYAIQP